MAIENKNRALEMQHIPQVLSFFGLAHMDSAAFLPGGHSNHSYQVKTIGGEDYIVKFSMNQTRKGLENDVAIQRQLQRSGLGTIVYLHNAEGRFIFDDGPLTVVSPLVEGRHLDAVDGETAFMMGETMAKFHKAVTFLPYPDEQGWLSPAVVSGELAIADNNPIITKAKQFVGEGEEVFAQNLPAGIIHADFHERNFLVDPGDQTKIAAVLDFEDSSPGPFIIDAALSMLATCHAKDATKMDPKLMSAFLLGYSSIRQLTVEELRSLPKAFKYVAGARILWQMHNDQGHRASQNIGLIESLDKMYS